MKRIITGPTSRKDPERKYRSYQEPCRLLELGINKFVPEKIAMEATVKLMKRVCVTYTELMANRDLQGCVLKSVVHSSVTSLECLRDVSHPTLLDFYKIPNCDLIYKALPLFRGLRAVKLGVANRTEDVPLDVTGFKDTLEEFVSRSFVASDLETLARNCRFIKCLDINGDFNRETKFFRYILSFRDLIELDLSGVISVPVRELLLIFNSLGGFATLRLDSQDTSSSEISETSDRSEALRMLGCNFWTIQGVYPRIDMYKNLTSLKMSNVLTTEITQLRELRHLKKLTFRNSRFSLLEEILPEIGKKLICLDLTDVAGTDIRPIGTHCRLLECLHLNFTVSQYLVLPVQRVLDDPSTVFGKVTSLKLYIEDLQTVERILDNICNVKKLVMSYPFVHEVFIEKLITRNWLKNLEELYWADFIVIRFSEAVYTLYEFSPDGKVSVRHIRK
jgi:hypothetical protein